MKTLIVIPCRYQSTRLPKKHSIELANGKTIFQMVYEKCVLTKANKVVIATDHKSIYDRAQSFGAEVVMTNENHTSGTSRIAEALDHYPDYEIVINAQGDEPLINPSVIDALCLAKQQDRNTPIYSVMTPFSSSHALLDPNNVKVVVSLDNRALYFSRAPIATGKNTWQCYKHLGLYAFEREFLHTYVNLPPTPLSTIESLEQLCALEHGYAIGMICVKDDSIGIDTEEDLKLLRKQLGHE